MIKSYYNVPASELLNKPYTVSIGMSLLIAYEHNTNNYNVSVVVLDDPKGEEMANVISISKNGLGVTFKWYGELAFESMPTNNVSLCTMLLK